MAEDAETNLEPTYLKYIESTDSQFSNYFDNIGKGPITNAHIHNVLTLNRASTFLIENPEGELSHIIWITKQDETYMNKPLEQENWSYLRDNPEMLTQINQHLNECLKSANNFYSWSHISQGLVIEETSRFRMEAGDFMGMRISFQEVKHLSKALQAKDLTKIKKEKVHLTASMIHELTHSERDDGLTSQVENEIASHIAQFIFNPSGNEILNTQLRSSLEKVKNNKDESDNYDQAQYNALLIISNKLAEANPEYKKFVDNKDIDQALRSIWDYCNENEVNHLKKVVLPQIMQTSSQDLLSQAKQIEEEFKEKAL